MSPSAQRRAAGVRAAIASIAVLLAGLDLAVKDAAERLLTDGEVVDLSVLQLRIGYNSGVSFSAGDTLPGGVVLTVTGLIALVLAVFAWRTAPHTALLGRAGLAAVLAGALANLTDRAADGVVTDYLHTGWFPTFNLADTFITVGAALLVLGSHRRGGAGRPHSGDGSSDPDPRRGGTLPLLPGPVPLDLRGPRRSPSPRSRTSRSAGDRGHVPAGPE